MTVYRKALLVMITALFAVSSYAAEKDRKSLVFGDVMFFYDKTPPMAREQAKLYCDEQGAELAKINNQTVYNSVRLQLEVASYWIDGIDRADEYRFELTYTCSFSGLLNFYGIPTDIHPTSCLSLVRGKSAATSKLQAANCDDERIPLCQFPMNGCDDDNTPPPFNYG